MTKTDSSTKASHYLYENEILHEIINEVIDTLDTPGRHRGLAREERRHLIKQTILKAFEEGRILLQG